MGYNFLDEAMKTTRGGVSGAFPCVCCKACKTNELSFMHDHVDCHVDVVTSPYL
jgi:hypothetical protein